MGFKKSASFKVMPGVRVRVSANGVAAYAGGRKVASRNNSGSSRTTASRLQAAAAVTGPARPGMFAPREEKALYSFIADPQMSTVDQTVLAHPQYAKLANNLLGLRHLLDGRTDLGVQHLRTAQSLAGEVASHSFTQKYLGGYRLNLAIAGGVVVDLPVSHDAATLALAEGLQLQGQVEIAIYYVESLDPSYPALLSLTDLYSDMENWPEIIRLTNGISVDSELTAVLALLRAKAHLALGEFVAAKECLKPLTASKKYGPGIRFQALALRAEISLSEGSFARALADLEKILAEDSSVPGLRDALTRVQRKQQEFEQQKIDAVRAKERAAELKREEAERSREEKRAEMERIRLAKAAERAQLKNQGASSKPAIQATVIDLSSNEEDLLPREDEASPLQRTADALPPGFYADPQEIAPYRYWDGSSWTSRIRMQP